MIKAIIVMLIFCSSAFAQFDVIWERTGAGPQSRYGADIFTLGDQNGDGYDEFAVKALGWGGIGEPSEPVLELFRGGNPPETEPYMVFRSEVENGLRLSGGWSIGDFNGDGFRDWYNFFWDGESPTSQTRIYWGGPESDDQADWVLTKPTSVTHLNFIGSNKSIGYDFNGDGFSDIYYYDYDLEFGSIYFGSAEPDTIPDWTLHDGDIQQLAIMRAFGDLNGDGYDDMVSVYYYDLYVFLGSAELDTVPSYIVEDLVGSSKWITPDINGDGRDDLVAIEVGFPIRVYLGRDTIRSTPDFEISFNCGTPPNSLSGVGDVNDDGYQDFMMIKEWCNELQNSEACLYLGYNWLNPDPPYCWLGGQAPYFISEFYTSGAVGDVNGDGVDDFGIGALGDLNWPGQATILAGNPDIMVDADDTPSAIPQELALNVYPNPFNAQATIEFDVPSGARQIDITIYNTLGQLVHSQNLPAMGSHMNYHWQAEGLPSGAYLLHVDTQNTQATKRLLLIR